MEYYRSPLHQRLVSGQQANISPKWLPIDDQLQECQQRRRKLPVNNRQEPFNEPTENEPSEHIS